MDLKVILFLVMKIATGFGIQSRTNADECVNRLNAHLHEFLNFFPQDNTGNVTAIITGDKVNKVRISNSSCFPVSSNRSFPLPPFS